MAATTILRTRTRFRPPKIRLHCRLRPGWRYHSRKMAGNAQELKTLPKNGLQGKILFKEIIVQFQVCYDRWMKEVKKHFFTGLASIWNSHLTRRRPVCYSIYCVSLNFKHWLAGICGYFILCLEFNSSLSQWVFCFISRNCLEEKQNVSIAWQLSRWIKGEVAEESGHNPSFVKLHFKVSSPIYLVLHYLYKLFYESISNNIKLVWSFEGDFFISGLRLWQRERGTMGLSVL